MDTITINGKEVPVTEVAAFYARKEALEQEATTLRQAQEAAKAELAKAAGAVDAIERAKSDPQFAKSMVDAIGTLHADSAFFRATVPETPVAPEGAPVVTLPEGTPIPTTPPPAPTLADPNLQLAQQVETLQRSIESDRQQRYLDERLAEIQATYPTIDTEALLKKAIEQKLPLEHLPLLASDFERQRLAEALTARDNNNWLLDDLLSGGAGTNMDENLAGIGSGLSAAQVSGDAEVDYANLSTDDALVLAFKEHGATPSI